MAFNSENAQVILAVLDRGSFSAAARALGRVPSAVSMAIAHLEAELGVDLFDRAGREPRPTAAARALEPQARLLAAQLRRLDAHARALSQGLEARLAIAIAPELLSGRWSGALARLAGEHPLLEVEVLAAAQADAVALLHAGRVQLALVFERPSLDGREDFQEVGRDTLVMVAAAGDPVLDPAASGDGGPAEGGARLRAEQLTAARQVVVTGRDQAADDPRIAFGRHRWRTDNPVAALALIAAGVGWGWLPQGFVQPHVDAGRLRLLAMDNITNGMDLWVDVVWSQERPLGRAARRFVELMAQHAPPAAGPRMA